MKVLISAQADHLDALVDPRFGRARWLMQVDTETGQSVPRDNSENRESGIGPGLHVAQDMAAQGVEAVITGNVGPAAFRALSAAGIRVYLVDVCTVREAVERLVAGKLPLADKESVAGHWA